MPSAMAAAATASAAAISQRTVPRPMTAPSVAAAAGNTFQVKVFSKVNTQMAEEIEAQLGADGGEGAGAGPAGDAPQHIVGADAGGENEDGLPHAGEMSAILGHGVDDELHRITGADRCGDGAENGEDDEGVRDAVAPQIARDQGDRLAHRRNVMHRVPLGWCALGMRVFYLKAQGVAVITPHQRVTPGFFSLGAGFICGEAARVTVALRRGSRGPLAAPPTFASAASSSARR